jgi:hypothetical protein
MDDCAEFITTPAGVAIKAVARVRPRRDRRRMIEQVLDADPEFQLRLAAALLRHGI